MDRLEKTLQRRMRILQVITGLKVGGAERVLMGMGGSLSPEKYEVH